MSENSARLIGGSIDGPVMRHLRAQGIRPVPVVDDGSYLTQCPYCKGRGARVLPSASAETECHPCEGTGEVIEE